MWSRRAILARPCREELEKEIDGAGIMAKNGVGLDPGIDHLYALKKNY